MLAEQARWGVVKLCDRSNIQHTYIMWEISTTQMGDDMDALGTIKRNGGEYKKILQLAKDVALPFKK